MRNYFYYAFLLTFIAASCQEQSVEVETSTGLISKIDADIKVIDGRLYFPSEGVFEETLMQVQNGVAPILEGRLNGLSYNRWRTPRPSQSRMATISTLCN